MMNLNESNKQVTEDEDNFKRMFKYFKSKLKPPDMSDVLDFHHCQTMDNIPIDAHPLPQDIENVRKKLALKSTKEWKIYSLPHHPGLFIICNAFTERGSMLWIKRCLQEFSERPYKTNLLNLGTNPLNKSWWDEVKGSLSSNKSLKLVGQLRWATMGYHHNWDIKEYSESEQSPMPDGLEDLCKVFLHGLGHSHAPNFKAEAAIINYYPPGSTLSPHTDHSEPFKEAPLISLSFGQSGVFLIGGTDKATIPTPLFLHHGDVMVMAGYSRLCYHAVPRILTDEEAVGKNTVLDTFLRKFLEHDQTPENSSVQDHCKSAIDVAKSTCEVELSAEFDSQNRASTETKLPHNSGDPPSYILEDLEAILNYLKTTRINMNVRQVKSFNPS